MTYGYIRISSADQNEARQIDAMKHVGVDLERVFFDKQSGKDFDRPGWLLLKKSRMGTGHLCGRDKLMFCVCFC